MLSVVSTWPDWLRVWRPSIATALRDNGSAVSWCQRCCATFSITSSKMSFLFFLPFWYCQPGSGVLLDSLIWFQKPANFTFSGECSASGPWKWRHPSKMVMKYVRERMDLIADRGGDWRPNKRFQWCLTTCDWLCLTTVRPVSQGNRLALRLTLSDNSQTSLWRQLSSVATDFVWQQSDQSLKATV